MTTFWNPSQVLDVHPNQGGFTCTGTTKKGLRCRNSFISGADLRQASTILENLSRKDVVEDGINEQMERQLSRLAELTLCPRWHKHGYLSQIDTVSAKWARTIRNFCAEERRTLEETRRREVTTLEVTAPEVARERRPLMRNDRRQERISLSLEELDELLDRLVAERLRNNPPGSAEVRDQRSNQAPEPASPVRERTQSVSANSQRQPLRERVHTTDVVAPRLRSPVVDQLPSPPATPSPQRPQRESPQELEQIPQSPASPTIPAPRAPITPPPERSEPATPEPRPRPSISILDRARGRRSLENPCYICYEPFESSEEATWCRRSCGQNVHKECFQEWSSGKMRTDVKCAFCRAQWLYLD